MKNHQLIHFVNEIDSTHQAMLQSEQEQVLPPFSTLLAAYQRAGRGQDTNVWHSQKGSNILMSTFLHPLNIEAHNAFVVSAWISLILFQYLEDKGVKNLYIKWPNDIYVADKKIAGILIQNVIHGSTLVKSIVSVGFNLNQTVFPTSVPNPVSLSQITGHMYDISKEAALILQAMQAHFDNLNNHENIFYTYMQHLYRAYEWHTYKDAQEVFEGKIVGVESWGYLKVKKRSGVIQSYDIKEIKFLESDK